MARVEFRRSGVGTLPGPPATGVAMAAGEPGASLRDRGGAAVGTGGNDAGVFAVPRGTRPGDPDWLRLVFHVEHGTPISVASPTGAPNPRPLYSGAHILNAFSASPRTQRPRRRSLLRNDPDRARPLPDPGRQHRVDRNPRHLPSLRFQPD